MSKDNRNRGNNRFDRKVDDYNPDEYQDLDKLSEEEIKAAEEADENPTIEGEVTDTPNALLYNTSKLSPVAVTYRILISNLKKSFKEILSREITDIYDVIVKYRPNTGEVYWYVIFNENSRHFTDTSLNDTLLANQKQKYYSNEIRKFAARFGMVPRNDCMRDADGRIIGDMAKFRDTDHLKMDQLFLATMDGNNNRTKAYSMRLSWTTLVSIMFDFNGNGFAKKYGVKPNRTDNKMYYKFSPRGGNPFGALNWLEVIKESRSIGNTRELTPRESFDMSEG